MATRLADDGLSFRDTRVDDNSDARPTPRRVSSRPVRGEGAQAGVARPPAIAATRRGPDPGMAASGPPRGS